MSAKLSVDPLWPRAGSWPTPEEFLAANPGVLADLAVVGVPAHLTSLSPTNAHETPAAVRDAVRRYSPTLIPGGAENTGSEASMLGSIVDFGDVTEPDSPEGEARTAALVGTAARAAHAVCAIGGDNSVTVAAALGAFGDDLATAGLVTLDAHYDLRDGVSNGSPVRRLVEEAGLDPKRIVQIGISDFANSQAYADRAREWGITVINRDQLHGRSPAEVMRDALAIAGAAGGPVHLDVDVDVCDRSVAPACPASVPGGIQAWELRQFVRAALADSRVRSLDLVEVDATADTPDQRTVRLTALCLLEAAAGVALR